MQPVSIDFIALDATTNMTLNKYLILSDDSEMHETFVAGLLEFLSLYLCSASRIMPIWDPVALDNALHLSLNYGWFKHIGEDDGFEEVLHYFLDTYLSHSTKNRWRYL